MFWRGRDRAGGCQTEAIAFAACVVVVVLTCGADAISTEPLLLVVLFDGFRWDYLEKFHNETPNFHNLVSNGVRARHVINVMPTVTMANHYTILTGTYPEKHGIVANNFYDPKLNRIFKMARDSDQTDPVWFDTGVEPIWVTNQLANSSRSSGTMLWPDSLAPVKQVAANHIVGPPLFDTYITYDERIDTIINWFTDIEKPINLCLLYFGEPDEVGHHCGPNCEKMRETVKELDNTLGKLINRLNEVGLFDVMNILLTADHGMTEVLQENHVDIFKFVDGSLYKDYQLNSLGLLNPIQGKEEEVFTKLKELERAYNGTAKVYHREDDYMRSLNFSANDRISPIIVSLEKGFYLARDVGEIKMKTEGLHGYEPSVEDMHPFFIAHGPAFKTGFLTETLYSIDFYELMCYILDITPAPNNGSLQNIQHILSNGTRSSTKPTSTSTSTTNSTITKTTTKSTNYTVVTYFAVAVFCALVAGVFVIGALRQKSTRNRVVSLEDITIFEMKNKHELKVPLLGDGLADEESDENFDI